MKLRDYLPALIPALVFVLSGIAISQSGPVRVAGGDVPLAAPAKLPARLSATGASSDPTEAPTGFTLKTNGFTSQEDFEDALADFSDIEPDNKVGPTMNARGCAICHDNPVVGGSSQITETRVGTWDGTTFTAPPGGTLLRDKATSPAAQQRCPAGVNVFAKRLATSLFGLAFVEWVRDGDLIALQASQPIAMRGTLVPVTVVGLNPDGSFTNETRIGRFGWKCQFGDLPGFAAGAGRDEIGITSVLQPFKALGINGQDLTRFVKRGGLDDPPTPDAPFGKDVTSNTRFMRSLTCPPRHFPQSAESSEWQDLADGEQFFKQCNCQVCHVQTMTTAATGSIINGFSKVPVPAAFGGKTFHLFGDCMTHDLGIGDGIVQGAAPRNEMRTAFLAGIRCRPRLMHDGESLTIESCVRRHGGQAATSQNAWFSGTTEQRRKGTVYILSL